MKERTIVFAFFVVLVGLMILLFPLLLPPFLKWKMVVFVGGEAILGSVLLYVIFAGLGTLDEEERALIQVFGSFSHVAGPGLFWTCPWFMKIRAIISTWEQSFPIFVDADNWIDFSDGRARPKRTAVSVRALSPDTAYPDVPGDPNSSAFPGAYRMVYLVDDWRKRGAEETESTVRAYFATIELDVALEKGKAGFNLLDGKLPEDEKAKLKAKFALWGLELLGITIGDFDLPKEVLEIRDSVQEAEWKAQAAKAECEQVATETMGTLVHMIASLTGESPDEVQNRFASSDELEGKGFALASDLIVRQLSLRHNALRDVRAATGSPLGDMMALASEFFSRRQEPNPQPGQKSSTRNADPTPTSASA